MKTIELTGTIEGGWVDFNFILKDSHFSVNTSYIGDGVENILSAVNLLNAGIDETECIWHDEPHTHILNLQLTNDILTIACFLSERWTVRPLREIEDTLDKEFEFYCSSKQFKKQILLLLKRWEADFGRKGYEERWHHPFPEKSIKKLMK